MVFAGGGGGEPAAVSAHDFVDDEHAGVGVVFGDDVLEEDGALLGGGPGAEALFDGVDVVVDGLGKADDGEGVAIFGEVCGEVGGGGVGVVATDGMEDVDVVAGELFGGDVEGVFSLPDEAALHAVLDVGEFDAAIADGAAAVAVGDADVLADARGDEDAVALEEALIAVAIAEDLDIGGHLGIALDEGGGGSGQAGGEAPGCEDTDSLDLHEVSVVRGEGSDRQSNLARDGGWAPGAGTGQKLCHFWVGGKRTI